MLNGQDDGLQLEELRLVPRHEDLRARRNEHVTLMSLVEEFEEVGQLRNGSIAGRELQSRQRSGNDGERTRHPAKPTATRHVRLVPLQGLDRARFLLDQLLQGRERRDDEILPLDVRQVPLQLFDP